MDTQAFRVLGIALGLGLLVGLQRERAASRIAGIRTFALICVLGALCGLLAGTFGAWLVPAGLVALTALVVTGNTMNMRSGAIDPGITTEVAALVMYGVGAYVAAGNEAVAVAAAGGVAILLQLKRPLHSFVQRIGEQDIVAIMQFVLISLVILPVLPDRTYGPLDVLNPSEIWLMVVLIVGISLGGYITYKLTDARSGTLLRGLLGGLVSSTATTVAAARRRSSGPQQASLDALVVLLASSVVLVRILIEIAAAAPGRFASLAPPLAAFFGVMVVLCVVAWRRTPAGGAAAPEQQNPAQLGSALAFGALYAVVLLAVAAAQERFGQAALYGVAVVSGLTDVDAITLSTARLVAVERLSPDTGWRLILVATLSNLVFKGAMVALLGTTLLRVRVGIFFAAALAAGLVVLFVWPDAA